MHKKQFYSRRVVNRRQRRLKKLEKQENYLNSSSENDNEDYNVNQHIYDINSMTSNDLSALHDDLNTYKNYHDDEHDNTNKLNDFQDTIFDHSPPLYDGCRFSTIKSVKMLINFFCRINLDKQNTINLMKLIKLILPIKNTLPTSWKCIMKLFGKTNFSSTMFFCSKCFNECEKTRFNTKTCMNDNCYLSKRTLKTNEIVEVVNLDIRSQMKSIITRNINLLTQSYDLFPPSDVTSASLYGTTISNTKCNIITIIIHTDGAPLVRSSKQSIWPCFASIVELPPPIREHQTNIMLLALWSAKVKPNVNVFLERTISDIKQLMTHGFWSGSSVLYPYDKNNLELRTHSGFIAAAKSAEEKSTEKRVANVEGVKGHVQTLIKRWCQLINKADIMKMDSMLSMARFPHNIHVMYNESILAIDSWKAKHSRLLVLNLGIPIGIACLPTLHASHWTIYCLFVKLLHAPQSLEEIDFAEKLINYYCRTIVDVYDESLELFSLHAHLHLPGQVRLHGGLSTSSAFTFESCIRYLKSKVHGTKHLATQIAYWYDIETIVKTTTFELTASCGVNEINFFNEKMNHYRNIIVALLRTHQQDLNQIIFYTRYKKCFLTFHTVLYDKPYKCRSYIVSYINNSDDNDALNYANIIVFYKYHNDYFALIQKYHFSRKKLSHYVELPVEICQKLDKLFPLLELSDDYDIIPVAIVRHQCVMVEFEDVCCLSELRIDSEHD
ncbi:unnamed protein product [Rotaria sp. Silwood1]|nr:unnamed protein product [Rotaria sp. Silwood1]CAF4847305.1 unnamed protein product [Rotaria sp. Silwood1]CAF4936343.1 unnamed protein product [Rotaria sp. Silwood1]